MTNKQFLCALRQELKLAKASIKQLKDFSIHRYSSAGKIHLIALYAFMQKNPDLTNAQIEQFIRYNPTSLRFLNEYLDMLPNIIEDLRQSDPLKIFHDYYKTRRQYISQLKSR